MRPASMAATAHAMGISMPLACAISANTDAVYAFGKLRHELTRCSILCRD
jgi:hypothetical protein